MTNRILLNQIELAYSPLSNYDFALVKTDPIIQNILTESKIYVIAQRSTLYFDNISYDENSAVLHFIIKQIGNLNTLEVKLPIFQKNLLINRPGSQIRADFGSHLEENSFQNLPFNNIHGMKFYQDNIFKIWFTPEKFMHNYWKGYFEADISGEIRTLTKYKVHYVGKSTDQDIWKRLTGHSSLQDILSLESPIDYGSLPTHEIAILFFRFLDNLAINTYDQNSDVNEIVDSFMGKSIPDEKTIYTDAEKALINAMQPKYNKVTYANYPKSSDGLYKHKLNVYSYSINDDITLEYENGEIEGRCGFFGGDEIVIEENAPLKIVKSQSREFS